MADPAPVSLDALLTETGALNFVGLMARSMA